MWFPPNIYIYIYIYIIVRTPPYTTAPDNPKRVLSNNDPLAHVRSVVRFTQASGSLAIAVAIWLVLLCTRSRCCWRVYCISRQRHLVAQVCDYCAREHVIATLTTPLIWVYILVQIVAYWQWTVLDVYLPTRQVSALPIAPGDRRLYRREIMSGLGPACLEY